MGTTMNRAAYERLIAEDLVWLESQTPSLDHVEQIVRWSIAALYDGPNPLAFRHPSD